MQIFRFRPKTPFLNKFTPENQNYYAEFNGDVQFFFSCLEKLFLGIFGPKNQNCQFELKFGSYTDLNTQNSMM